MAPSPHEPAKPARGVERTNVTIHDVARAANVAVGTASKALNGQGKLRTETRERVQQEAARLGFRPNDLAQSLLRGRSLTVGLLSTDPYGRFSLPLLTGIEDALGAARLSVFLCNARDDAARERAHLDTLLAKRVDGIIVTGRRTDLRPPIDVEKTRVPVIYAYTQVADPEALCLLPDDAHGGQLAAEHLLCLGRRHLAHITGPDRFAAARLRRDAFRDALAAVGLVLPAQRILAGDWGERWGYAAAASLLARDPQIDAIFCGSDLLARGAADALRERGVRVPADVALIGFDNWDIIAAANRPPLTSVDPNLHDLGVLAGTRLLALIAGEQRSGVEYQPCRLVIRESCGAIPADNSGDGGENQDLQQ